MTAKEPLRLGPCGPDVRVKLTAHGAQRIVQRIVRELGIHDEETLRAIFGAPDSPHDDAPDPSGGGKLRRWSRVRSSRGAERILRIVFVVNAETTDNDPGEIEIVSVVLEREIT